AAVFVSRGLLFARVIGVVVYGIYGINLSLDDLLVMAAFGVLGYVMAKLHYPSVPLILGVVIGPMLELGMRRSLITSRGDFGIFFGSPIAVTLLVCTMIILLLPLVRQFRQSRALSSEQSS